MGDRTMKFQNRCCICNSKRQITSTCYNWAATRENQSSGFSIRPDTNRPVQSQKQARSLKFWIDVEEELNYPSSENKGADQLRSNCEADLRLCFRISENPVFSWCGSYDKWIRICKCTYVHVAKISFSLYMFSVVFALLWLTGVQTFALNSFSPDVKQIPMNHLWHL